MKVHKTSTFKQYLAEGNPLTVCGIQESYTRTKDGKFNRVHVHEWHRLWSHVTCKRCLKKRKAGVKEK